MATYHMELSANVTCENIRKKFRAFCILYGSSKIWLRGCVWVKEDSGRIIPAFFNTERYRVVRMAGKFLYIDWNEERLRVFLTMHNPMPRTSSESLPEIMFMSDKP